MKTSPALARERLRARAPSRASSWIAPAPILQALAPARRPGHTRSSRARTRTTGSRCEPGTYDERAAVGGDVLERDPRREQVRRRPCDDEHRIAVQTLRRPVLEIERLERDRGLVEDQLDHAEDLGCEVQVERTLRVAVQVGDAVAVFVGRAVVVAKRGGSSDSRRRDAQGRAGRCFQSSAISSSKRVAELPDRDRARASNSRCRRSREVATPVPARSRPSRGGRRSGRARRADPAIGRNATRRNAARRSDGPRLQPCSGTRRQG